MSCPCEFQPAIQVHCVMELIGLVTSGKLAQQKSAALEHVGCFVGSFGAYLTPDIPDVIGVAGDIPASVVAQAEELKVALAAQGDASAINPDNLKLLFQFLMNILPLLLPLFTKE